MVLGNHMSFSAYRNIFINKLTSLKFFVRTESFSYVMIMMKKE